MEKISLIVLFFLALVFIFIAIYIGKIFGISSTNPVKGEPYECGIETKGVTWIQFNVGYYLFALLFLIFDVEIIFLYPLAVALKSVGVFAFFEILLFTMILFMGLLYAYKKGALSWK